MAVAALVLILLGWFASPALAQLTNWPAAIDTLAPLVAAEAAPRVGTFFSWQRPGLPPLPFASFPSLPLYDLGGGHYLMDDRAVDYAALREQAAAEAALSAEMSALDSGPPAPPGGGGGGGTNAAPSGTNAYSVPGLKLTVPAVSGSSVTLRVFDGTNGFFYDLFRCTNLVASPVTNTSWTWHGRLTNGQTKQLAGQPGQQAFYQLGSPLDTDHDGLSDAYETRISHTATNAASFPDTDGDGMPDAWEVLAGLNPQANDAAGDADGDGLSNLQEFLAEDQALRPREPLGPCSRRTPLVISEIMYHPASGSEFVEIYNSSHLPQRLDGFALVTPVGPVVFHTFASNSVLAPGSFTIVTPNPHLPGSARIQLRNSQGAVLLDVEYSDRSPWPLEADGAGHSLVLARPSYGENDVRAWGASDRRGGSPRYAEPNEFTPLRFIKINEFLANGTNGAAPDPDSIELYNAGGYAVDISGCHLGPSADQLFGFSIPAGTVIPPRGFRLFVRNQADSFTFGVPAAGGQIFLTDVDATRILDVVTFPAQAYGVTTGRTPDGGPTFVELASRSPGTTNAAPVARNIVISEIMFNPISGDDGDQYLELFNRGATNQNLLNWGLSGVGFRFTNTTIAPGNYLVIALDPIRLANHHPGQLTNGVNLLGPFSGRLAGKGERLVLTNDTGAVIDEVTYCQVRGIGYSLHCRRAVFIGVPSRRCNSSHAPGSMPMAGAGGSGPMAAAAASKRLTRVPMAASPRTGPTAMNPPKPPGPPSPIPTRSSRATAIRRSASSRSRCWARASVISTMPRPALGAVIASRIPV